jgi:uncharacterized protein (DUF486 family)
MNQEPPVRAPADQNTAHPQPAPDTAAQLKPLLNTLVDEIRDLKLVNIKIATQRPDKTQFVWNVLLQVFALFIGFIFGIFAILAWLAARKANNIASSSQLVTLQSNQLALMTYCLTIPAANSSDICVAVQGLEHSQIAVVANGTFGSLLYPNKPDNHTSPVEVRLTRKANVIAASVGGVAVALAAIALSSWFLFRRRMTRMNTFQTYLEQTDPNPMRRIPAPKAYELGTEKPSPPPSVRQAPRQDPPGSTAHELDAQVHDLSTTYGKAKLTAGIPSLRLRTPTALTTEIEGKSDVSAMTEPVSPMASDMSPTIPRIEMHRPRRPSNESIDDEVYEKGSV